MKQLKYIGQHKPAGMIVEAEDSEVDKLLESGDYELIGVKPVKKEEPIKLKIKKGRFK